VHHGVDTQPAHQLGEQRVTRVCVHELGAVERHLGILDVEAVHGGHVVARFQSMRQLAAQSATDAGDENPVSFRYGYG